MAELLLVMMYGASGIGKLVVLKRIWPELASDPHLLTMFHDEARLAVRMTHPNVVQTYEVFDDEGRFTLAMEYLDGQPLGRVLNRMRGAQALPLALRLRIVTQVLAALHYAHELRDYDGTPLSVVHRDVSPPNVFVTYDGAVKLIDFGIAKNQASAHQTRPGIFKGRFSYVAPEQFLGRPVDRRSDVFAVGVILWEMLAGRRFWGSATDAEIASRLIANQPLPTLPADPAVPAGLEAICSHALQLDRVQRYATAAEMQEDVQRALADIGETDDRVLGRAVASSFASELAQRQQIIDQHVRKVRSGTYSTLASGSLPRPVVPPTRGPAARPLRVAAMAATVTTLLVVLVTTLVRGGRSTPDALAPPAATGVTAPATRPGPAARASDLEPPAERIYVREAPAPSVAAAPAATPHRRRVRAADATASAPEAPPPGARVVPAGVGVFPAGGFWTFPPPPPPRPPRPIDTTNPFLPAPAATADAGVR
jgi:serine/threonine protein kinase